MGTISIICILLGCTFLILKLINIERDKKKISEYHEFSSKIFRWLREIENLDKRGEFLIYHIEQIQSNGVEDTIEKWHRIPVFKRHIEDKWSDIIPSLKVEIRDRKIKSILND